jgi:hypothetical protein
MLSRITGTFAESGARAALEILGWSQLHTAAIEIYNRKSLGCGQDQTIAEEMSWSKPRAPITTATLRAFPDISIHRAVPV